MVVWNTILQFSVSKRKLVYLNEVPLQSAVSCTNYLISYDLLPAPVNAKEQNWLVLYLPQLFIRGFDCSLINLHVISWTKVFLKTFGKFSDTFGIQNWIIGEKFQRKSRVTHYHCRENVSQRLESKFCLTSYRILQVYSYGEVMKLN